METPDSFDFPFPPYDIQLEFMKKLYYTLENGKLGIFESPTGTGKSLSIICGAIKWLKDRQNFEKKVLSEKISKLTQEKLKITDSADWISTQSKEIEINSQLFLLKKDESKILNYEVKIQNIRKLKENKFNKNKLKFGNKNKDIEKDIIKDDEIELDDLLLNEFNKDDDNSSDEEDESSKFEPLKIYICSRTHSQLSQFLGEIIKSPFGRDIRVVSLASRQTFCINTSVQSLKSMALINERCLDLQKKTPKPKKDEDGKVTKKSKGSCSCPYYKQTAIEELTSYVLTEIQDIEDLIQSGQTLKACPYYTSRKAAEDAEVILVPYNTILHKSTREANGIKLKNNVVIIDEAHNLLEAMAQMHNSELNYCQVFHSLQQLKAYKERFKLRFSSDNLLHINQVIFVVNKLLKKLEKCSASSETSISTIRNFVSDVEIDQYNMFTLTKFCNESRLAQKIRSYAMKYPQEEPKPVQKSGLESIKVFLGTIQSQSNSTTPKKSTSNNSKKIVKVLDQKPPENPKPKQVVPPVNNPLLAVISFLDCLKYSSEDGRIFITKSKIQIECKFQFLLLKPSIQFKDIVKEARSVIVAGGTMAPMTEFKDRLFINSGGDPERIIEFSCDHIIPPQNILPIIITKGLQNENLLFNYEKRMSMASSIKNILVDTCKIIPGGIVVFFPSYDYENLVWQQLQGVNFGRELFREPKTSSKVDVILDKYAKTIKTPGSKGALLFSVVGGKLSEGLNFSDDLGRCVIVIGMPYSNISAVDLKEKMSYLDKTEGAGAGKKFYENQCMKSVNQCIGRAVRHRNDYATVILLDQRYSRDNTKNALPKWIKKSLKTCTHREAVDTITEFFKEKESDKKPSGF